MTPKFSMLLSRCIEDGLERGYRRAYKHNDAPTQDAITDNQYSAIMTELGEWFDFGDKYADAD